MDKDNIGQYSVALGFDTKASGIGSTALGNTTIASGTGSASMGLFTTASGNYSIAMGRSTTAKSEYETVFGVFNTDYIPSGTSTGRLFTVGNGTALNLLSDAIVISKNGNIYIDASNKNDGTVTGNTLLFGTSNATGEGIGSKRTATGNQYGLDFYTSNINRMSISNGGNVGIGNSIPGFPLSFAPVGGDKISLWSNSTNSYGFGIQSSLLQIHTDIAAADIAFGYGSSTAFTETMRIKGNGALTFAGNAGLTG